MNLLYIYKSIVNIYILEEKNIFNKSHLLDSCEVSLIGIIIGYLRFYTCTIYGPRESRHNS